MSEVRFRIKGWPTYSIEPTQDNTLPTFGTPRYRIVTSENGNFVVNREDYPGEWVNLGYYYTLTDAKDAIQRHKNAGKVVWEE